MNGTHKNAGTAMRGWGRLEKTLQRPAFSHPTPRGTRTRLIASPSGMLCTAMAVVMNSPSEAPPPKETPTPTPSVKECAVMTPTMSSAFLASKAPISEKATAPPWSSIRWWAATMAARPSRAPATVCGTPYLTPS